jgi:hypothetical protein
VVDDTGTLICLSSKASRPFPEHTQTLSECLLVSFFAGVRRPGDETDRLSPSNAEIQKTGNIRTSIT